MSDTVIVLEAEQEEGPNFVTVVEAGLLAKSGFNSTGIGLATNALVSDQDRGQPGVPYHVILRGILETETMSDALVAISGKARASAANYLLKDVALWDGASSPFRLHHMQQCLKRGQGDLSPGHLQNYFGDHHNYPSAICRHQDPRVEAAERYATIASVIMDLDEQTMWVAAGNPCSAPYHESNYATLLNLKTSFIK